MGDVLGVILGSSAPGLFDPERPRPVARPVLRGLAAVDHELARERPDAMVVVSTRWLTTFHHYVAGAPRFGAARAPGRADRAVGTGSGYRGDPALARALVMSGRASQVPVLLTEEPALPPDDATVTPLLSRASAADLPIVPLSICQLADLAQSLRWGRAIAAAVQTVGRRALLVAADPGPGKRCYGGLDDALKALVAAGGSARAPEGRGSPETAGPRLALLLGALGPDSRSPVTDPRRPDPLVTLARN
jgi:hypothetical protein